MLLTFHTDAETDLILHAPFAQSARMVVAQQVPVAVAVSRWTDVDDLQAQAVVDQLLHRHGPGRRTCCPRSGASRWRLGEYYSERETPTPAWLLAGDTHAGARLVGLTDARHAAGDADAELVARWLDDGITPNGAHGRAFGQRGVRGFDLTFCAPNSVSLVRALRTDDVVAKAIADAHTTARGGD